MELPVNNPPQGQKRLYEQETDSSRKKRRGNSKVSAQAISPHTPTDTTIIIPTKPRL